ncbi:Peptidoglycan/xylan/chitin deacetylase, PgdA/CDA1 family [Modestobacter sp. DSM 44400]|uniref:polysaccharide deacetylase family protein n=1 Tax=Modestobacter sp. DSM 44400 TaxID=1550230 RepID=UPI000898A8F2|nr:polysaccharide deacetylase family protein [Modestobacter sp. DSM 44400]SDY69342.1 Peptidoglycan/xylan/chitin deacetylase, PgdA/CDA1 family [Modestobacter sp. DSM 44400]
MENELFGYEPITERPPLVWPGGARVAFYLGLNIEHYQVDKPSTSIFGGTAALVPDALNYGWRDYGPRVGIWRLIESLDRHGIPASAIVNSDVFSRYPQIVRAGLDRNWAWVAHGRDNSTFQAGMGREEERAYLAEIVATMEAVTGRLPQGWLGPALTETFQTPALLAELGLGYTLDWTNDDQPYELAVPGMLSVPYSIEMNDVTLFVSKSYTGPEFLQAVRDQLDQLYDDAADSGRVMALCVHPFSVGQPFRHTYLDQALEYVAGHSGVWVTTSDEIAAAYREQRGLGSPPEGGATQ